LTLINLLYYEPNLLNTHPKKGSGIGNFSVYSRDVNQNKTLLYRISGEKGNNWILGQVSVPSDYSSYYDLIFEATIGRNLVGNIGSFLFPTLIKLF
jgi:hypothetical protein